uniref:Uncharacterized protein LOC104231206 n=1 Tax=Nicotiana sylvestris TaxID=4096 RepID=A0A1U7X6E3_NICSY|nr:PREDICTED: uncharacterized protein LOC104231206 [Nicotiana sylvestris]
MASPPNLEEGQSTYRPPKFNGQHYGWWKARMHDFIMAKDCELWDIICDGPYVPTKVLEELPFSMETTSKEYTEADKKAEEKNFRAKKILVYGIGPEVCGKPEYFMKDCPLLQQEFSKNHHERTAKTNSVPIKDFKRKGYAENMMR